MNARMLFDEGRVEDAIRELGAYLREQPGDSKARTFLFELLTFSGQFERARKQLEILAGDESPNDRGVLFCAAALSAEESRHNLFREGQFPRQAPPVPPSGTLNGKPFQTIRDLDSEIGARLEVYAGGGYLWLPFAHIASIEIREPKSLSDTLWLPAIIEAAPGFAHRDMGEVLLPAIYAFSWRYPDQPVWLGRQTAWMADEEGHEYPMGQKVLLVDGQELPLLEVRKLEFHAAAIAAN